MGAYLINVEGFWCESNRIINIIGASLQTIMNLDCLNIKQVSHYIAASIVNRGLKRNMLGILTMWGLGPTLGEVDWVVIWLSHCHYIRYYFYVIISYITIRGPQNIFGTWLNTPPTKSSWAVLVLLSPNCGACRGQRCSGILLQWP